MKPLDFIFNRFTEEQIRLFSGLFISLIISSLIFIFQKDGTPNANIPEDLKINLNVMIPKNHILYPFEAANFDSVEPLLEAYNMVQVYNPKTGALMAKNIKVLRAPKDPSHLAFLIPVNIANKLAPFGLDFKIAVQKYINKEPLWVLKESIVKPKLPKKTITFGG